VLGSVELSSCKKKPGTELYWIVLSPAARHAAAAGRLSNTTAAETMYDGFISSAVLTLIDLSLDVLTRVSAVRDDKRRIENSARRRWKLGRICTSHGH